MFQHVSASFPQGFPPAPPSQEPSVQVLNSKFQVLSTRRKRQVVMSTELVERQWLPWHCKAVEQLGTGVYLELADMAMEGEDPPTLFTWLIREELEHKAARTRNHETQEEAPQDETVETSPTH